MKIWTALAAATVLAACSQPADAPVEPPAQVTVAAPSGEYTLDPYHSTVTVRARHFGLANYTLRFNRLSGALNFNADNPAQSSVTATIDVTSLDTPFTGDRDFDAELQNSEWLDSAGHAAATFTSTAIEQTGPNTARVTGDLTLKGVTRPITLDVTYNSSWRQHPAGPPVSGIGFSARGVLNRADFGVNAMLPQPAEPQNGIANEVELLIEAEFTRPIDSAPVPPPEGEPTN